MKLFSSILGVLLVGGLVYARLTSPGTAPSPQVRYILPDSPVSTSGPIQF